MDYYGGKEFYVNNPTLGDVKVGKRGIKSSVQHRPIYGTKIEGFKALKEIISSGLVINASRNYAGKRNDRICVAAPIKIGDDIYYAGVIINRNVDEGMQNYYLNDVITIEKNSLSLKDTEAQKESARMDETVFPYNILQQLNNINNLSENDVISDEGRFSLKDTGVEVFEYESGNDADRIEKVNVAAEEKGVKFSLKNENITIDTKIPYVHIASYVSVRKGDRKALDELRIKVKNLKRGTYENRATGY